MPVLQPWTQKLTILDAQMEALPEFRNLAISGRMAAYPLSTAREKMMPEAFFD